MAEKNESTPDNTTCSELLRLRYLDRQHELFALASLEEEHKIWLNSSEVYEVYVSTKKSIKDKIRALEDEMNRLAALGKQVDMNFDI